MSRYIILSFSLIFMIIISGCVSQTDSLVSLNKQDSTKTFLYQLQNVDIEKVTESKYDIIIMDYSKDGSDINKFTKEEINKLKKSGKIVLAYMSIGEAEDYRYYWQKEWETNSPPWLGKLNPNWPGNIKVKYWDTDWKRIIYGSQESYLDKLIEEGFDGVYLDIIDGYEYWSDEDNGEDEIISQEEAEKRMIDFVSEISSYAKSKRQFLIFPQNGANLGKYKRYLDAVDGIGKEDTWYLDNEKIGEDKLNADLKDLDRFKNSGKTVLVVDYIIEPELIEDFYKQAIDKNYVPFAGTRNLDRFVEPR